MESFEEFIKKFGDIYDYHFISSAREEEQFKLIKENKDGKYHYANKRYLEEMELKDKRIKLLYDIYCDCHQYNIYLCSKICEIEKNFDTEVKYEKVLYELKQNINMNISSFVLESSNNKVYCLNYAIKILTTHFEEKGDVFIVIHSLMKQLLFVPH
jgi:hypothetical protein